MPKNLWFYTTVYLIALNLLAALLTIYDKHASRRNAKRIRERTLLTVSAIKPSIRSLRWGSL